MFTISTFFSERALLTIEWFFKKAFVLLCIYFSFLAGLGLCSCTRAVAVASGGFPSLLPVCEVPLLSPFLCMVVQTVVHFQNFAVLIWVCPVRVWFPGWSETCVGIQITGASSSPSLGSLSSGTASSYSNLLWFSWPQRWQSFHLSFSHLCCTALHLGPPLSAQL